MISLLSVDRRQVADGRGQLQLAVSVSVRVPASRGEDRVPQETEHSVAERRRVQGSAQPHAPDLGRRSHLQ